MSKKKKTRGRGDLSVSAPRKSIRVPRERSKQLFKEIIDHPLFDALNDEPTELDACYHRISLMSRMLRDRGYSVKHLRNDPELLEREIASVVDQQKQVTDLDRAEHLEACKRLLRYMHGAILSLKDIEAGVPLDIGPGFLAKSEKHRFGIRCSYHMFSTLRDLSQENERTAAELERVVLDTAKLADQLTKEKKSRAKKGASAAAHAKRERALRAIELFDPKEGTKSHRARLILKRAQLAEKNGEFEEADKLPKRLDKYLD